MAPRDNDLEMPPSAPFRPRQRGGSGQLAGNECCGFGSGNEIAHETVHADSDLSCATTSELSSSDHTMTVALHVSVSPAASFDENYLSNNADEDSFDRADEEAERAARTTEYDDLVMDDKSCRRWPLAGAETMQKCRKRQGASIDDDEGLALATEEGRDHRPLKDQKSLNATQTDEHQPLVLFGQDLSHFPPTSQFVTCASGVFAFTIVYGYLQELLAVHIAGRRYGLFLATCQFAGYALWSFVLTRLRGAPKSGSALLDGRSKGMAAGATEDCLMAGCVGSPGHGTVARSGAPLGKYVGLSLLRAVDLGMTNVAMQFLNYPAKTLIKSSRVVFTMLIGIVIGRKKYMVRDYVAVLALVFGLGVFLHADSRSNAVFHPIGVAMLCISLTCDGTINNWSELIMNQYSVGQDEFQLRLYSLALLAMTIATHLKNELLTGIRYFVLTPGSISEIEAGDDPTWTIPQKIIVLVLFSTSGLFGSSCAGAITKRFGALSMSITSTARKAATLFLSFLAFPNQCTPEHVVGMVVFLSALLMKSLCARASMKHGKGPTESRQMGRRTRDGLKYQASDVAVSDGASGEGEDGDPLLEIGDNLFQMAKRSRRKSTLLKIARTHSRRIQR